MTSDQCMIVAAGSKKAFRGSRTRKADHDMNPEPLGCSSSARARHGRKGLEIQTVCDERRRGEWEELHGEDRSRLGCRCDTRSVIA